MTDQREQPEGPPGDLDPIFPEQDDDLLEPKRTLTVRGVAIVGGRVAVGLVGMTVAVLTVAASALLPLPSIRSTPPSSLVTPVPTAQRLVCPGAVLRLGDDRGQGATTSSAIGVPVTRFASSTGAVDSMALKQSDAATGGTPAAPTVISTPPNRADPNAQLLLSGAQGQLVAAGDYVGLAATDCAVASGDVWLVGGSTAVGRTTLLSLSNPSEVPATVNLELFGENGAIAAPGTSGIIVPASGQRVLSLAGFQPNLESPVVHVTSTGGQVVAELQQSTVRGLAPGGVDLVGSGQPPALTTVIPGLRMVGVAAVEALQVGGAGYRDLPTVLRMFAPGQGTVTTTINVAPENNAQSGTSTRFDIEAGRVVDVPIGNLTDGSYTVRVVSPVPLVAAVRVSSAQGSVTDFAWLASAAELQRKAQVTVAPGPNPILHLTNPTSVGVTVTVAALQGGELTLPVAAGSSAIIPVAAETTYSLSGFDRLFAAVTLAGPGAIAHYPVHPPGAGSTPLLIYR